MCKDDVGKGVVVRYRSRGDRTPVYEGDMCFKDVYLVYSSLF